MSKYNPLAGKKILVVGSGIGFGTAEAALHRDAIVFVASSNEVKVESAVARLKATFPNGKVFGKTIDLDSSEKLEELVKWVDETGEKGLDHIVFTAGNASALTKNFDTLDLDAAKSAYDLKVFGTMRLIKAAKPFFNKGASISLTLGTVVYKPHVGAIMGTTVGGSVEAMTRGLGIELAPIRVNAIAPGLVDTELWDGMPPERKEMIMKTWKEKLPLHVAGNPEDIAQGFMFLASSQFVTGQTIVIDGGQMLV
ncbi:short-chain dehydrogenase/reductase SDR [Pseudohyphozyma bogoriensis]|nr:short-chain dehydrogenase/reductase SDR [Pseudohyphozyma bogoriensis]